MLVPEIGRLTNLARKHFLDEFARKMSRVAFKRSGSWPIHKRDPDTPIDRNKATSAGEL